MRFKLLITMLLVGLLPLSITTTITTTGTANLYRFAQGEVAQQVADDLYERYRNTMFLNGITITFSLILALGFALGFSSTITKPLESLLEKINEINENNLTNLSDLPEDELNHSEKDEIGKLHSSYSAAIRKLVGIISVVQRSSIQVDAASGALATLSEEVNALSEEILQP